MYGIYANIWGILMVNVTIYGIHIDPMGIDLPGSTSLSYFSKTMIIVSRRSKPFGEEVYH